MPWEIGLAETQQTLLRNDLRSRIIVQTDGQLKTGRDVAIAAMLGADEFGFSTAPLIATGCIMMRACHLNTCPVGIATQDPELRKRFEGTPEHVVNFFFFVAEELRGIMASLGVRVDGRADRPHRPARGRRRRSTTGRRAASTSARAHHARAARPGAPRRRIEPPPPVLDDHLDWELLEQARAGDRRAASRCASRPRSATSNRCVGGILSSHVAARYGPRGCRRTRSASTCTARPGRPSAAGSRNGVTFTLHGDANDYTGKGLSGGTLAVLPPEGAAYRAEENVIIGNTVLYGATSGKAFFRGLAGERFAVRNSGADAVVEGVGDHGCEYMTGGRVVVLGPTGRNFAAGMSGGLAFVLDEHGTFRTRGATRRCSTSSRSSTRATSSRSARSSTSTWSAPARRSPSGCSTSGTTLLPKFVKVFPTDYKRVLAERAGRRRRRRPSRVARRRSRSDG